MRKPLLVTIMLALVVTTGWAQQQTETADIPNMGRAPQAINGVGRLDLRVFDQAGNPVPGARVVLESRRTDGYFCEAFNSTDARGVAVMPPLHMGDLRVIVKAKGYDTLKTEVSRNALGEPVRVTLVRK